MLDMLHTNIAKRSHTNVTQHYTYTNVRHVTHMSHTHSLNNNSATAYTLVNINHSNRMLIKAGGKKT
jgi:hypothetical protein